MSWLLSRSVTPIAIAYLPLRKAMIWARFLSPTVASASLIVLPV